METEDTLAMLSTLGGAYSCLGESDEKSAATAGLIAVRQLCMSSTTGDPNLIARCCVYEVYSYCQRGMRRRAIRLMKVIHQFLTQLLHVSKCDPVLVKMYQAACHRITYMDQLYSHRKNA